jgi:NADPH:quinone reductase-like Zn-dependent oxidoreductase
MLEEFVDLKEGDVIVQNGANSAVGQVRPFISFQATY